MKPLPSVGCEPKYSHFRCDDVMLRNYLYRETPSMRNTFALLTAFLIGMSCATSAVADLTSYSQDFEGLNMGDPGALAADGWLVFGNVFDGPNYLYGYGPFPAPNDGAAFCQIATGEQGPNQGTQYLNVFSDYNNTDHANGFRIESNVFQEQRIGSSDLGQTFDFIFDDKASFLNGPAGDTTTFAFIKVLDSNDFSLLAFETFETTMASNTDWAKGNKISLTIDSGWDTDILQFGFLSNATRYEPSGVYYDNISFRNAIPEPASATLLAIGMIGLAGRRRR